MNFYMIRFFFSRFTGGSFPPPPVAAHLMTLMPPPVSFHGPFPAVDNLMNFLIKINLSEKRKYIVYLLSLLYN